MTKKQVDRIIATYECIIIAFIVLKFCGITTYSWWVALSPLWGGLILAIILIASIWVIDERQFRKARKNQGNENKHHNDK